MGRGDSQRAVESPGMNLERSLSLLLCVCCCFVLFSCSCTDSGEQWLFGGRFAVM